MIFTVTAMAEATGYHKATVTHVGGARPNNSEEIVMQFVASGLSGDKGATCATGISWSVSPEGTSNTVEVTLTMQDGVNSTVNDVQQVILWLSGNATGEGLVSSTASGALTVTAGTQLGVLTAKKALVCLTNDSGQLTFTVEDSSTGAFYPSAFRPLTGRVDTGSQVVSGNYN